MAKFPQRPAGGALPIWMWSSHAYHHQTWGMTCCVAKEKEPNFLHLACRTPQKNKTKTKNHIFKYAWKEQCPSVTYVILLKIEQQTWLYFFSYIFLGGTEDGVVTYFLAAVCHVSLSRACGPREIVLNPQCGTVTGDEGKSRSNRARFNRAFDSISATALRLPSIVTGTPCFDYTAFEKDGYHSNWWHGLARDNAWMGGRRLNTVIV